MMSYPAIHSQGLPLLRMLYHDDERLLSVYYDDGEMISGDGMRQNWIRDQSESA